jgi:Icc-related predicted phosphoesterase
MKVGDIPLVVIPADVPLVRFLVMSDTHGMEERLFDDDADEDHRHHFPLNVDVVLHCGDWWSARGSRDRLDRFLAEWIHQLSFNEVHNPNAPMLIVVRGNHDPGKYKFSLSNALYVTQSTRLDIHGLTIEIRPYNTCGVLCDDVDVLVSHEPPHGLLDQAYNGEHGGSTRLLASVKGSPTKPKVWCFGHIHEARGVMLHRFDSNSTNTESTTILVNAASENDYRTKQVKSGPILLLIGKA